MPTAESVLMTARAFTDARILLTAAELDVFTLLAKKTLTVEELARELDAVPRGLAILLDALVAMELLEKNDGKYNCPPSVAPLLAADSPRSVLPMVMHAVGLWRRWSALTDIVKNGSPDIAPAAFDEPGQLAAFIGAMHVIGCRMAPKVVEAVKPGNARKLLDIGGASGTYTEAFLQACPGMCATLFDRPPVVEMARKRLQDTGLLERIALTPGDFYVDELPGGHDLAFLSAIIHQNSPEQNIELYKKIYRALEPGGRIVVRDHVMSPDHVRPAMGALFAVNMLVATPAGGTYSFEEIRDTLAAAGFERIQVIQPDTRMDGLVEGFKPGA